MLVIAIGSVVVVVVWALWNARRLERERRQVCAHVQPDEVWQRAHDDKVARIAAFLRHRDSDRPLVLRKRVASHQVPKAADLKYSDDALDIRDLDRILDIDPVARTCTAEPGVTFIDLVAATLELGLVPILVPEFKTITIGGAVAGCAVESMSFQEGGFHDGCLEYEVITAKGEVLVCTPDNEHALLFQMMHGTFGTLGVLSKLKFKLVPAQPFVKVSYQKFTSLAAYKAAIWHHYQARDMDFMDGIVHAPDECVLSLGRFVDWAPFTNRYDWTKAYCESTNTLAEDYLKTADYFFRYDRGVTSVHPKSTLGRLLFGKFLGSSQVLELAARAHWLLGTTKPTVTVDVFIPFSKIDAFIEWCTAEFGFFPLWVVPYRRGHDYEWISDGFFKTLNDELFVDLAIYGMKQQDEKNHYKIIEDKLLEMGGVKTLISHNYYSEQDFWKTWNKSNYDAVKAKTDPNNVFRDLYSKTCRATWGIEGETASP